MGVIGIAAKELPTLGDRNSTAVGVSGVISVHTGVNDRTVDEAGVWAGGITADAMVMGWGKTATVVGAISAVREGVTAVMTGEACIAFDGALGGASMVEGMTVTGGSSPEPR